MNYQKHCEQLVLTPGSSIYYALLFEKPEKKQALIPLIAFTKTIYDITMSYREADIAKTKLQWWQQEIIHLYLSQPNHPISHALLPVISQHKIPQQLFLDYLDGAILKIDTDHFCTEKDIALFSHREFGVMLSVMCYVLTDSPTKLIKHIPAFAYSLTLIDMIVHAKYYFEHDKQAFSAEASDYATQAEAKFDKAVATLSKSECKLLRSLITYNKLQLRLLNEIKKDGFNVFQFEYHLTPLRKFFIAWMG